MKKKLELEFDEVIILKEERIMHGNIMAGYTDTLILTNKRIIFMKKGIFGNIKDIISNKLSDIKIYNGRAQVLIGKTENSISTLDIYFAANNESFGFIWKKDIIIWIKKINELTTGKILKDEEINNSSIFIPAMESMAKTIKSTIDVYKDAFGIKKKEEYITCHCKSCGAPNSGIKGNTAKCTYCNNYITFNS